MCPAKVHKRANAPFAALYRSVEPVELPGAPRQPRHRHTAAGFASRLRALLTSIDFRQLAGPTAVFFLWPPKTSPPWPKD